MRLVVIFQSQSFLTLKQLCGGFFDKKEKQAKQIIQNLLVD